jgi:hypothetical protein
MVDVWKVLGLATQCAGHTSYWIFYMYNCWIVNLIRHLETEIGVVIRVTGEIAEVWWVNRSAAGFRDSEIVGS